MPTPEHLGRFFVERSWAVGGDQHWQINAFEAICETCTFFQTSIEFRPTLQRQRDHAADHDQTHRADLFERLLARIDH
jgi:hypothetical protein